MKYFMLIVPIVLLLVSASTIDAETLEQRAANISRAEMQSVMEFLAHDLLEGRGPATRGGNLSEIYMRSIYKLLGFEPGFGKAYMQPFTLKGFTMKKLDMKAGNEKLNHIDEVVGTWIGGDGNFNLEAEAVFIGFGIEAGLWKWDDYKNVDIRNKFAVIRVNDPGMFIPDIFEGKTLTYYGRWTYHLEEASRRGAVGALLIHTDASAGYDWNVVKNSWSGEEVYLESDLKSPLKFRGWIKESNLKKVLAQTKFDLTQLYKKSLSRKFKPINLGFKIAVSGVNIARDALNHNVVAVIPGKSKKQIVISSHIDHLGKGDDSKDGTDTIYNGAVDSASAVAAMMVTAKILKEFQRDLYYTVVVLACHSEEAGLLGSKHYVRSMTPEQRKEVIANINFESTPVWEKASDFMAIGARFSTLEDMLKQVVKREGLDYSYFSLRNQGLFYRSDQYSFARYNIPAIWISAGENDASGTRKYSKFWKTIYHTVKEEYNPDWPLESMAQTIKLSLLLIDQMNREKSVPKWKGQLTFPLEN